MLMLMQPPTTQLLRSGIWLLGMEGFLVLTRRIHRVLSFPKGTWSCCPGWWHLFSKIFFLLQPIQPWWSTQEGGGCLARRWPLTMLQSDQNIRKLEGEVGLSKSEQIILHASTGSYLSTVQRCLWRALFYLAPGTIPEQEKHWVWLNPARDMHSGAARDRNWGCSSPYETKV